MKAAAGWSGWEPRHGRCSREVAVGRCGKQPRYNAPEPDALDEISGCWLRFRPGSLSFAWRFPRLCSSSLTNSRHFLILFGSGRIALAPFIAPLTQLLLVQIGLELFIGKTTAETSGGNGQRRCNFYWPATRYHMPRAFRQRIAIRKRKLTTTRSTLLRHSLSAARSSETSNQIHSRTPRPGSRGLMMPAILSQTAFTAGRTVSHGNAEPGFACS
jgi:hypothetical protein